jgi:hypothetical protein
MGSRLPAPGCYFREYTEDSIDPQRLFPKLLQLVVDRAARDGDSDLKLGRLKLVSRYLEVSRRFYELVRPRVEQLKLPIQSFQLVRNNGRRYLASLERFIYREPEIVS